MFLELDRLSAEAKRHLLRLASLLTVQFIAEDAQIFAAKLRDGADDIRASDALMAFAAKIWMLGSSNDELLLALAGCEREPATGLH